MIAVLFTWYGPTAGGKQTVFRASMPQVPAKGDTVWVPVDPDDQSDPDNVIAKRVFHVGWCNDETVPGGWWHAEVALA